MKKTPSKSMTVYFDSRQVGLMLQVAVLFKPSIAEEIGADSPEEATLCAELMQEGLCAPAPAVLRRFNLRRAGERYAWTVQ